MLADYQHQIVPILQKHGGTIHKFMGDGIMVTFGAALPTETYAANSLRAILLANPASAGCAAERRMNKNAMTEVMWKPFPTM